MCPGSQKQRLATTNMHVFFVHNHQPIRHVFLYAQVVLTSSIQRPETRCEVLWNFSMVMSGWQVTSQVTSTYYYGIKLHQSCTVYWQCGVLTFIQKHRKCMAGQIRRKIWKSGEANRKNKSWGRKGFAPMAIRIRGETCPPAYPLFRRSWHGRGLGGFHHSLLDPMANMQQQGT